MHRFLCFPGDGVEALTELHGAYLFGNDGVPVRGDIKFKPGEIRCECRVQEPLGISLLWPVKGYGVCQLQTTRLPARNEGYNLSVELARHQLMRISLKREEWGLFDYSGMDDIAADVVRARDFFIQSLEKLDVPAEASRLADQSLAMAIEAGERLCQFHANVFLTRRQQSGGFNRPYLGVGLPPAAPSAGAVKAISESFDFVRVPMVWRELQATERGIKYDAVDAWVKAIGATKVAMRGGPLLNFGVQAVPDWMYIWENDFESIHDAARDHVTRVVQRYGKQISTWIAASGLHADNVFSFNFEQIMELTRMASAVIRQLSPRSQILIELTQPWGEYYARGPQTIPPLLYADMLMQSGVNFDGFGLQFLFGIGSDGYHVRDLLQVSSLIDKLANLGKPIHITALAAPSAATGITGSVMAQGGLWKAAWSDAVQADWIQMVTEIALSKPYVETVCMQYLSDSPNNAIAAGGVLREDGAAKPVYAKLQALRKRLASESGK